MPSDIKSQILVVLEESAHPLTINPSDEVTHGDDNVSFPEGVLLHLVPSRDSWIDVWADGEVGEGVRSRIGFRIFGRRVISITHAYIFPPEKDMIQS